MSDQPSKKLYDQVDLRIFQENPGRDIDCNQSDGDPIDGCIAVKRLIVALIYYSRLNIETSKDGQNIFIAFINHVYTQCLDDYTHLVRMHNNLEQIHNALQTKALFPICDITQCHFSRRHHSRRDTIQTDATHRYIDNIVQFYAQIMDSFHFYVTHLFECGLRIENITAKTHDHDHNNGDQLGRVAKIHHERQYLLSAFDRFIPLFIMLVHTTNSSIFDQSLCYSVYLIAFVLRLPIL
eukprot:690758_1